jgi:hypothetical protein
MEFVIGALMSFTDIYLVGLGSHPTIARIAVYHLHLFKGKDITSKSMCIMYLSKIYPAVFSCRLGLRSIIHTDEYS